MHLENVLKMAVALVIVADLVTKSSGKPAIRLSHGCSFGENAFVDKNGKTTCLSCPVCPPGQGANVECESRTSIRPACVPCVDGRTYNDKNTSYTCLPCRGCEENEHISQRCEPDKPTICQCKRGFYKDRSECLPCSRCCGPPDSAFIAKKCQEDGMPVSSQCEVSDARCHLRLLPLTPTPTSAIVSSMMSSPTSVTSSSWKIQSTSVTLPQMTTTAVVSSNGSLASTTAFGMINKSVAIIEYPSRERDYVEVMTNPLTYVIAAFTFAIGVLVNWFKWRQKMKNGINSVVYYRAVTQLNDKTQNGEPDQTDNMSFEKSTADILFEGSTRSNSDLSSSCTCSKARDEYQQHDDLREGEARQTLGRDSPGRIEAGRQALNPEFQSNREISLSALSIIDAVKNLNPKDEADISLIAVAGGAYFQQLLQVDVSKLPSELRKTIGLKLSVPDNFGYDGRQFLEDIGVPKEERDAMWAGVPMGTPSIPLWQGILDKFIQKTDGKVGTLRNILLEKTQRRDIAVKIIEWMKDKCKADFERSVH